MKRSCPEGCEELYEVYMRLRYARRSKLKAVSDVTGWLDFIRLDVSDLWCMREQLIAEAWGLA